MKENMKEIVRENVKENVSESECKSECEYQNKCKGNCKRGLVADPLDFSTIKFHCIFSNQLDVDQNHDSNDHSKHSRTVVVLDALGALSESLRRSL